MGEENFRERGLLVGIYEKMIFIVSGIWPANVMGSMFFTDNIHSRNKPTVLFYELNQPCY